MRVLLDEMLSLDIARQLRRRSHDVVAVAERETLRGASDAEIFQAAQSEQRAVLTQDVAGFELLDRVYGAEQRSHFGLVVSSSGRYRRGDKRTVGDYVGALDALLKAHPGPEALRDRVVWLR